jgi:hypothetical protein
MNQPPDDLTLLRLAVQNLACAPQAQRRYVQMGLMARAIGNLDRLGGDLQPFLDRGDLDDARAAMISALREEVLAQRDADPDFVPEAIAGPREFLFGDALETEGWSRVRRLARPCHSALVGERSPFMAIMAK